MEESRTFGRVHIHHVSDGLGVAEVGPVCVVIWRKSVTRPRFDQQRHGVMEVSRKYGHDAAFLCVIEPNVPPPSEELRKASSDMIDQSPLCCYAAVIEATGFMAALTRSVLSGISLFGSAARKRHGYFGNVAQSAVWMSRHTRIEPTAFGEAVQALRERMDSVMNESSGDASSAL